MKEEHLQMKAHIMDNVLNFADLNDLNYHVRMLKVVKD